MNSQLFHDGNSAVRQHLMPGRLEDAEADKTHFKTERQIGARDLIETTGGTRAECILEHLAESTPLLKVIPVIGLKHVYPARRLQPAPKPTSESSIFNP